MEASKLKEILEKHKMWLNGEEGGERANLRGADLRWANLYRANLREADLYRANLNGANLSRADLRVADLSGANLRGVDLSGGHLSGADLSGANLSGANLSRANLSRSNINEADLRRANLSGADLYMADLRGVYFTGANLSGTYGIPAICCPEEGSFIGFKKAADNYIVKLLILDDAKRSSATTRKCRCSKAKVLSITELDGSETDVTEIELSYDSSFIYRVGETVEVPDFDNDRWHECAPGIHFFVTRQEVIEY